MDKKRLLLIILFSTFAILVGIFLWRLFFASPEPVTPPDQTPTSTGSQPGNQLPTSGSAGDRTPIGQQQGEDTTTPSPPTGENLQPNPVTSVIQARTSAANISSSGKLRFYNEQDGRFYEKTQEGSVQPLSDTTFFQAQTVTWSPANDQAIIEYPDGSNIYYNFETDEQVTLPAHWEDFSFATQGDQIAAKSVTLSPENRWLVTADPDGQNVTLVEPLGQNGHLVTVDWSPNKQVVAFSKTGRPLGANRQEILLVGQFQENFKSLVVEGRGFESTWSPSGDKLTYSIYSQRSNFKPELWVVNASGEDIGTNRRPLNLATWAEKCSFQDDRFVFCGVPTTLQTGAGFAPETAVSTIDKIVRVDTQTGAQTEISTGDAQFIVDSLAVDQDGSTLYITDKRSGQLTEIKL